jgi:hypothetical protein
MNYQRIYNTIIERSKQRTLLEYTEEHHIVPRCVGGTDESSNLVMLTPEEHYVCHQLLVKIYPGNIKLVKAAMFMVASNKHQRRSNKTYGWLKKQYSEYMKGSNNPSKLNGPWNKGVSGYKNKVNFSDESIKLFSERMKKNNPCAGVKPWNHPRATDITKGIWARADEIYEIWLTNDKPAFCKLFGLCMNKKYDWKNDGKEVGPFMNLVKYFRNGWVPTEDLEWKELKETV